MTMMEVATHAPLSRSHTHPVPPPRLPDSDRQGAASPNIFPNRQQSQASSSFSTYSTSTVATAGSTLFGGAPPMPTPTATPVNGGPVEACNNVLNRRADRDQSLFQICINLRQRLMALPEVASYLVQQEEAADDDLDIVSLLWRTFRKGFPLMAIYNALKPPVPLTVDATMNSAKREKAATFKFLQACLSELKFPQPDCFILADLYGDDTTGFVKVTKVVNRVLDVLVAAGVLATEDPQKPEYADTGKRTQKEHIIQELVQTERTYVQHLELLQAFKKLVEEKGIVPGDVIHVIFLNLNSLLDFQRRFLIRVEQTNAQPQEQQNWGKLFVLYKDAFKVYEPYIANQKKCEEIAMREFDKLKETGGPAELCQMVESPTHLSSFLLKPFQRLAKYPLLLRELQRKGDLDEQRLADIEEGIEAASAVLARTNAALDLTERLEAVEELRTRVEDWKGHRLERFGNLLLYGTFTVLKGDGVNPKDSEREYKIYLFEVILLCCKEINPNKQKNKIMNKPLVDRRGKPKLQLKGRIFMQNVTETISMGKPGSYTCQIFWKGDPGIENFVIRFTTEDTMKKWVQQVDTQRRAWHNRSRSGSNPRTTVTSNTEYNYFKYAEPMENPYREDEGFDDDTDTLVSAGGHSDYGRPDRKDSTYLRSRSTTSDSSRAPPPRFPMSYGSVPPLSLRTQQVQQNLHGTSLIDPRALESSFSPALDSPQSSRTSSSSGMFQFPRQPSISNGWHPDDHNRYTAPAMGRTVSREGQTNAAAYQPSRGASRPSLSSTASSQQTFTQSRSRSASSPDIQNPALGRRMANGHPPVPDVPVPPFPTHYAYPANINRSHTNSPSVQSSRPSTQSPMQRDRHVHGSVGYDYHNIDPRSMPRSGPHGGLATPASMDYRSMTPSGDGNYAPQQHQQQQQQPTSTPAPSDSGNSVSDSPLPTQLKVKVHCPSAGSTMTLVVGTHISYQSLEGRIEAKLQRSTNVSLSSGQVKLKYIDEDDFVSIQSDEDVQTAFETWWEQQRHHMLGGSMGEIELYCQ